MNDSGNDPILFKLDTLNGSILQEITVSNATNVDWESLAQDDDNIYIGDFGNNSGNRDDLKIYIVSKNDLPETGNGSVTSTHLNFTYPDYPGKINKRKQNNFDGEALISIGDSLYIFSKNWEDNQTKLYRLPKIVGTYIAEKLYTFNTSGLITGADYNTAEKEVTLIGYSQATFIPFFWLLFDYYKNDLFSGNKRRMDFPSLTGAQTEAVSYTHGKNGIISNEENAFYNHSAYDFYTGTWTDTNSAGIGTQQVKKFDFDLVPNPVKDNYIKVIISELGAGDYQVEVYDTSGKRVQVKDYELKKEKSQFEVKLKVGNLKPGIYYVRMRSIHTIVEKKFIKQ